MAESEREDRTLPASPRRLEKAREEGRVARSRELSSLLVVGSAFAAFALQGAAIADSGGALLRAGLRFDRAAAHTPQLAMQRMAELGSQAALAFGPLLLILLFAALAAPMALGGWLFSWTPAMPNFSRISPMAGLGRMLSTHSWGELGKSVVKALAIAGVATWVLWDFAGALSVIGMAQPAASIGLASSLLLQGAMALLGAMALIAAIDVPLALLNHSRELRMTRREALDEQRESDGDPQMKARIRSVQREVARRRMMSAVPKATVVVTNPTRYAVAIEWREGFAAPRVVAKGTGEIARRIREIAIAAGVPLLEAPALARALHRHVDLERDVPPALYQSVASVLAWVFQVRTATSRGARHPPAPVDVPVPPGFDPAAEPGEAP